jgi:hypothetical protein
MGVKKMWIEPEKFNVTLSLQLPMQPLELV